MPDLTQSLNYEGNYWPLYVYIDQEISIDEDIEANIWVSDDNLLLVDGYPVYQYLGDESMKIGMVLMLAQQQYLDTPETLINTPAW